MTRFSRSKSICMMSLQRVFLDLRRCSNRHGDWTIRSGWLELVESMCLVMTKQRKKRGKKDKKKFDLISRVIVSRIHPTTTIKITIKKVQQHQGDNMKMFFVCDSV